MKGHGQFCPVAVACDVFAQRWTPLILRELFAGSTHFNEIRRGLPLISRTLLAQRLRSLEAAGVVASVAEGAGTHRTYTLTTAGREFAPVIQGLGEWGQRWTARVDRENLDADLLMWNVRRRLEVKLLPVEPAVVRFDFSGLPSGYHRHRVFWLLVKPAEVDLCVKDPGSEVDLYVSANLRAFVQVWLGDLPIQSALRSEQVRLTGRRDLVRAFPSWLLLSHFASAPRTTPG